MSRESLIEAHGKGMSGCDTLEQWAKRHLRTGDAGKYESAFTEVKKRQEAAQKEKEAAEKAIENAIDSAKKSFAR